MPALGRMSPAMMRSRVDLPAPLGPISRVIVAGRTSSEMFRSTARAPKSFPIPARRSISFPAPRAV